MKVFARLKSMVPKHSDGNVYCDIGVFEYLEMIKNGRVIYYSNNRGGYTHDRVSASMELNKFSYKGFGSPVLAFDDDKDCFIIADGNTRTKALVEYFDQKPRTDGKITVRLIHNRDFLEVYKVLNSSSGHTAQQKISNTDLPVGKYVSNFVKEFGLSSYNSSSSKKNWSEIAGLLQTLEDSGNISSMSVDELHKHYVSSSTKISNLLGSIKQKIFMPKGREVLGEFMSRVQGFLNECQPHIKTSFVQNRGFLPLMFYLHVRYDVFSQIPVKKMADNVSKVICSGDNDWHQCMSAIARKSKSGLKGFQCNRLSEETGWAKVVDVAFKCTKGIKR